MNIFNTIFWVILLIFVVYIMGLLSDIVQILKFLGVQSTVIICKEAQNDPSTLNNMIENAINTYNKNAEMAKKALGK